MVSRYDVTAARVIGGRSEPPPREILDVPADFEEYKVMAGDRIAVLAYRFIGDSRLWWLLADVNLDRAPDPQMLSPGTRLRVPRVALS